jgi:hypothetical protein
LLRFYQKGGLIADFSGDGERDAGLVDRGGKLDVLKMPSRKTRLALPQVAQQCHTS